MQSRRGVRRAARAASASEKGECGAGLAAFRMIWSIWIQNSILLAPNAGFAKAVVNLNTVWAAIVGAVFLQGKLSPKNYAGIILSTVGCYLCT